MSSQGKFFVVGDSYGLPRFHKDSHRVEEKECWPALFAAECLSRGIEYDDCFERGLTLSVAESLLLMKASQGYKIIYSGGLVDFFPRTLPQKLALNQSSIVKFFKSKTFNLRKNLHKRGFVYTWTSWSCFEDFFVHLSKFSAGYLTTIPPLVEKHISDNPNSIEFLDLYNTKIVSLAKKISWGIIDVNGGFFGRSDCFHPYDGHFNRLGNTEMCRLVSNTVFL